MQQSIVRPLAQSLRISSTFIPWIICCSVFIAYDITAIHIYILSSLLLVVSYGFVTIHNDLADYKIDVKNQRKDIPLASNKVSRKDLQNLLMPLLILGCTVGIILNPTTLLWLSMYLFLGWLYSGPFNFKGRGALAICILGICYGVMPFLLGFAILNETPTPWSYLLMIASFIFTAGIISLKDFKDLKGDTVHNKRTLLVKYGPIITHRIILALTCLAYTVVALGIYIATGQIIYTYATIVLLIFHLYLLSTKSIRSESKVRGRNGSIARLTFFLYVAALNMAII